MNRLKLKRKNQMWVSNNRMLLGLGHKKKDIGRNPNFDAEETKLLISLWGDPKVQKTLITSHKKHVVIAKLATKMKEFGYNRSTEEITTRIKNLKCFYNRLKKDMDNGINTGTTWKHFSAMDEIMTRSVFSVRPNEIPKPSLRYQMEIEREEREQMQAECSKANELAMVGEQMESLEEYLADESGIDYSEESHIKIKEEDDSNDASLLVPKEEPLDDDEVIFQENLNQKLAPEPTRIPEFIQLPNNANPNSINSIGVSSNCRTLVNCNLSNGMQTTTPTSAVNGGLSQSIIISNQGNAIQPTGKISLVPTNFLLQNGAQSPQIQIRPQHQPRIICSQPNATPNTGIVTSAGAGRMKVLLVNAFQNGKTASATLPKDSAAFSAPSLIPTSNIHKPPVQDVGIPKIPAEVPKQGKPEEVMTSKDPGMEMLFNKLIVMQTENNEIQRQRLEIERQRFEFEKSIADKFLLALTSVLTQSQRPESTITDNTMQAMTTMPTDQYGAERDNPQESDGELNSFQLLTPKLEKID